MKVLVCEDNDVALKVVQVALKTLNLQTLVARDGRKAFQLLDEHPDIDLIITDIHMPLRNGDEILTEVRENRKQETPFIMISSDTDQDVIKLAIRLGANEFVEKPLDPAVLITKVKKLLKI